MMVALTAHDDPDDDEEGDDGQYFERADDELDFAEDADGGEVNAEVGDDEDGDPERRPARVVVPVVDENLFKAANILSETITLAPQQKSADKKKGGGGGICMYHKRRRLRPKNGDPAQPVLPPDGEPQRWIREARGVAGEAAADWQHYSHLGQALHHDSKHEAEAHQADGERKWPAVV